MLWSRDSPGKSTKVSGPQKSEWHDTYPIPATIRGGPCDHDERICEPTAQLAAQPVQVTNIVVAYRRGEFHLDREQLPLGALDDQVDLVITTFRPQM